MLLILVRHARAVPRGRWEGPDVDRPLDSKGRRQSVALAERIGDLLATEPPPLVLSSPTLRCVSTVSPLAKRFGIPVRTDDRLLEADLVQARDLPPGGATSGWLAERLAGVVGDALAAGSDKSGVVICTHGDVLPAGVAHLFDEVDAETAAERNAKGGFWVVEIDDGRYSAAEYVRPS